MAVYRDKRRPKRPWVIDISYFDKKANKKVRYFRNAKLQTAEGARKEERQLLHIYTDRGFIPERPEQEETAPTKPELTFKEAVELYDETGAAQLKYSTQLGYQKNVKAHLLPRFGDLPLSKIDHATIKAFDLELTKGKLTDSTRNNILIPLRAIIRNAVELGRHDRLPDFPKLSRVKSKVYDPPTAEMVDAVVAAADPHVRPAIALAAYAGLRAGEVRGLRWQDVNLESSTLFVRQAITHGRVVAPKSGHERLVPISGALKPHLEAAKARPHQTGDPVAPSRKGTPWTEAGLRNAFHRALKRAQVPHTRLHGLRHFFITACFAGGASAPTVQKLAGHSHLAVTARYAHTNEAALRQAVGVFDRRSA